MRTEKLHRLSQIVMAYILLAFVWWAILLYKKNKSEFEAKLEHLEYVIAHPDPSGQTPTVTMDSIEKEFRWQKRMILGEAAVFIIALFIGIWFINRGYTNEIKNIRQKKNFLLAITHELKTPLTSIRLVFETILKRTLNTKERNRLAKNGLLETERLTTLINNLLLSAKLERSYTPLFEELPLEGIIQAVVNSQKTLHPNAEISFSKTEGSLIGNFDKLGIKSAVQNIVENAVKYSTPGSPIHIKLKEEGKDAIIEIVDQGIGIKETDRNEIFNQFFRSGSEETRQTKGTGLGLFIAKKMIEMHHGQIRIQPNNPKGSVFIIKVPKSQSQGV